MMVIYLLFLSIIDIKKRELSNVQQLGLLAIVLIVSTKINLIVPIIMLILFYLLDLRMPNRIGGADIKIFIYLSIYYNENIIYVVLISSIFAISYLIITGINKEIPFIPFITAGVTICQILNI